MTTRIMLHALLATTLLLALAPSATARSPQDGDWPQWRGPERTGISSETSWSSEGKADPLWTKELGLGHSSFAVAGGHVFTLGYDDDAGLDSVFCFDIESGAELWRHSYESEIWDVAHDGGTLTTPTIVDDVVYTSNREAKVFCLERASGEVRWSRDLREDMELEPPTWGFAASPLVLGDSIILNFDRVVVLDRHTGDEEWVSEKAYGKTYSTPAAFELEGRAYLAVLSGTGLALLDSGDGEELDFYPWSKDPEIYPMTPVVIGDRIFISAGYERGCTMLRVVEGRLTELWASRVMRNKMSGSVLWKGHLFGFDESILKCIDLDGNERWRERGMGTGSMTIAGGRMLILDGRGQLIVAEADPQAYVELSRQAVLDDGTAWSTPVLSGGRVYCRSSLGQMSCLDYRGAGEASARAQPESAPEIPSAEAIVARHVEAIRGAQALGRVTSVHMRGTSESLINTVRKGTIELAWDAQSGFTWSDASGLRFGYNGDAGWMLAPRSAPALLMGAQLTALRLTGDLAQLFDPARGYESMESVAATIFEGRQCYAVHARMPGGLQRTLYFEVDSGLYAGHQGEDISMWTLADYRDFDGVLLPTRWSIYEPTKGERATATFDQVSINPEPEPELFALPDAIKPFMRTSEEIEAANKRLSTLHAALLGEWSPEGGSSDDVTTLTIADGFLVLASKEREPSYLGEPAEDGSMTIVGADFVSFTPEKGDSGEIEAIQIRVGGEPRERLVRTTR